MSDVPSQFAALAIKQPDQLELNWKKNIFEEIFPEYCKNFPTIPVAPISPPPP